jgi:hypothetical protein
MSSPSSLRMADKASEPILEVSKWLKLQVLADPQEMRSLFRSLGHFEIYLTSGLTKKGHGLIAQEDFLLCYEDYANALKAGKIPDESRYRPYFSSVFVTSTDSLYALPMDETRQLIRASRPVVQLQPHSMDYSPLDGKFRPMIFGSDSILWGIQFSYPQLYMNPESHQVMQVIDNEYFTSTSLFKKIQRWLRQETIPTPFWVGDTKVNVPMRLGKLCLEWINVHPQLAKKNLRISPS